MTDQSMTDDDKRRDQLLRAGGSTEADAAPRIEISDAGDNISRIDIADTAAVRPGPGPGAEGASRDEITRDDITRNEEDSA